MRNNDYLFIVFGMMLVTFSPRLLPFILMKNMKIPKNVMKFLSYIPYAMLGAIIFPGVFTSIDNNVLVSTLSFLAGIFIIYRWGGTLIPIVTSVGVAIFLQYFMGL